MTLYHLKSYRHQCLVCHTILTKVKILINNYFFKFEFNRQSIVTDCPCSVWCRGLTTCRLYVCPLFWESTLEQQLGCMFDMMDSKSSVFYFDICNCICLDTLYDFFALSLLLYFLSSVLYYQLLLKSSYFLLLLVGWQQNHRAIRSHTMWYYRYYSPWRTKLLALEVHENVNLRKELFMKIVCCWRETFVWKSCLEILVKQNLSDSR